MSNDQLALHPCVAYFSMEMALDSAIPTYSGGLGVLAGDMMRSAADLGLPIVGVTMASRAGYFSQKIEAGRQVERTADWEPEQRLKRTNAKVLVRIGARDVAVTAWRYEVDSCHSESQKATVYLLDTDLPENHAEDRRITDSLYGGDDGYRLRQEIVLGIGGVRVLQALEVPVKKYHLNEGHAAFLTLELLRRQRAGKTPVPLKTAAAAVQSQCVFTTHTPVPAGHDQFDYAAAVPALGGIIDEKELVALAGNERLNMTRLALSLSGWVNGVAKRHAETSRALFPGYEVHAVTNGVHSATWAAESLHELFDRHIPYWRSEPELLLEADRIPLEEIRSAHDKAKQALLAYASEVAPGHGLSADRFTLGFARRMTAYKRPHLLFSDLERLRTIAKKFPIQVVLAGKAHPKDEAGKKHIEQLHAVARELQGLVPIVFLPDYNMHKARYIVSGVDVWLNTPQRPLEASGTSGMKAALNGVPNLSILDGWWLEGCAEGETGWAIGEDGPHDDAADSKALYAKLEQVVLPLFHEQPQAWAEVMRRAISRNGSFFTSHRMLKRYALEAYAR
ncbi:MAG TPA: alpha-glucan family phosphorylase [Ramlibacter sp.]|nr:alpha-glucan family phosphorylase [Ramlibacter sp.]